MVELTNSFSSEWRDKIAPSIRGWWISHVLGLMRIAIVLLAISAIAKLGLEFWRLIWGQTLFAATDLEIAQRHVMTWFAGKSLDVDPVPLLYPPASMAILYPFIGWMSFDAARWFWAATTFAALVWTVYLLKKYGGAESHGELSLVALFLLAMNATGGTIGYGQLGVHILPFLIVGLFSLRQPTSWRRDIVAALALIAALVKPSIAVPFLWIVLFSPGGWRVLGLITLGYSAVTLLAASFQPAPLLILIRDWLGRSSLHATTVGYANVDIWLADLGLGQWALFGSIVVLIVVGVWIYLHRTDDLWLVLGVTAIAARIWTYHFPYDDMLILFPMIALFRIAKRGEAANGYDVVAGLLLAITMLLLLLPVGMFSLPPPWNYPFNIGHPLSWIIVLVFLIAYAQGYVKRLSSHTSIESIRSRTA